jgi:hypothetical protein
MRINALLLRLHHAGHMEQGQLEKCWRVVGRRGSVFQCGIYAEIYHVEVRLTYGENAGVVQSRLVADLHAGRNLAQRWLRTVLEIEGMEEAQ